MKAMFCVRQFYPILKQLQKIVQFRTPDISSRHILLEIQDGKVLLESNNYTVGMRATYDVSSIVLRSEGEGKLLLPGLAIEYIAQMQSTVTIEDTVSGFTAKEESMKGEFRVDIDPDSFIRLKTKPANCTDIIVSAAQVCRALITAATCAGDEKCPPMFHGLTLKCENNTLEIAGSDRNSLCVCTVPVETNYSASVEMIIPAASISRTAPVILALAQSEDVANLTLSLSDNGCYINCGSGEWFMNNLAVEHIPYKELLNKADFSETLDISKDELYPNIRRIKVLAGNYANPLLRLSTEDGKLKFELSAEGLLHMEDEVTPIEINMKNNNPILLAPEYFCNAVLNSSLTDNDSVRICTAAESQAIKPLKIESGDYLQVIMPVHGE